MNEIEIIHQPNFKVDDACRTCGAFYDNEVLIPIFDQVEISTGKSFFSIIEELRLMDILIVENDNLPQQICIKCINELKNIHLFRDKCKLAQDALREYFIQSTLKIEPDNIDCGSLEEHKIKSEDLIKEEKSSDDLLDSEITNINIDVLDENEIITEAFESDEDWKDIVEISSVSIDKKKFEFCNDDEDSKLLECNTCLTFAYKAQRMCHGNGCTPKQNIFTCFYCTNAFNTKEEIINHIYETHPEDRPFVCPVCNESFKTDKLCETHVQTVHSDIEQPYHCNVCSGAHKNLRNLRTHKRLTHDTGNYECSICYKKFTNIYKFNYHIKSHNDDKPYKCKYCPKSFMQTHHLRDHEATHTGERRYHCKQCDKSFKGTSSYFIHMRHHKKNLHYCDICKRVFSRAALKRHMERHKEDGTFEEEITHLCSFCGKGFRSKTSLNTHSKTHNFSSTQETSNSSVHSNNEDKIKNNRNYDCPFCPEKFASLLGLQNHLKMHDENRKFKCGFCGVGYNRSEHLRDHINAKHTKTKKYYCSFCSKVFVSMTAKNSHEKCHKTEKVIHCAYCDKTFRRSSRARNHERTQHTKEKRHTCMVCNVGFLSYAAYKAHQSKHSPEELLQMKEKLLFDSLKSATKESENVQDEDIFLEFIVN